MYLRDDYDVWRLPIYALFKESVIQHILQSETHSWINATSPFYLSLNWKLIRITMELKTYDKSVR